MSNRKRFYKNRARYWGHKLEQQFALVGKLQQVGTPEEFQKAQLELARIQQYYDETVMKLREVVDQEA